MSEVNGSGIPPFFFNCRIPRQDGKTWPKLNTFQLFFFHPPLFLLVLAEPGSAFRITRACFNGIELSIDKALDVAQPPQVFPLLLDVDVVGHKHGHCLRDAPLLEESLH